MAVATNLQLHEQTDLERSCTFSSAVSVCLSVFTVCSPQHHSLANSGHDSCPDWGKEPSYCYMRFAKCNGRSSEGWNTEQILFAVRKQDWKNSAVKTSMTKHETATAANEVCLLNSVLGEAPWNFGISRPLIRELDKLLAWGLGGFGPERLGFPRNFGAKQWLGHHLTRGQFEAAPQHWHFSLHLSNRGTSECNYKNRSFFSNVDTNIWGS